MYEKECCFLYVFLHMIPFSATETSALQNNTNQNYKSEVSALNSYSTVVVVSVVNAVILATILQVALAAIALERYYHKKESSGPWSSDIWPEFYRREGAFTEPLAIARMLLPANDTLMSPGFNYTWVSSINLIEKIVCSGQENCLAKKPSDMLFDTVPKKNETLIAESKLVESPT